MRHLSPVHILQHWIRTVQEFIFFLNDPSFVTCYVIVDVASICGTNKSSSLAHIVSCTSTGFESPGLIESHGYRRPQRWEKSKHFKRNVAFAQDSGAALQRCEIADQSQKSSPKRKNLGYKFSSKVERFLSRSLSLQWKVTTVSVCRVIPKVSSCQVEEKEAKVWGKEEQKDIERFCVITSRASRSQQSVAWLAEEESREFLGWFMRRPVECWRFSWRTWFAMPSRTRSTPNGRRSLPWMWCMRWRGKAALCMGLVAERRN